MADESALSVADHLALAERQLAAAAPAIERFFHPLRNETGAVVDPPTAADMQGVLFALSVAQTHASCANAQLMMELVGAVTYAARRMGGGGISVVRA